ncbi:MAG: hypothetical protein ACLUYU_10650 [Coprococcus sp.]|jgi:hypothetical protein
MNLRLKRISKLNIVVAVFVSILLLFCSYVCPRLFVYASNSGVSKYLHGSQYVTKNGYYFEQSDYICGSDFCSSPASYECTGHCFDASGMPGFATDSAKKKFNSFLSSVGVDLSGLDLYFVLYERPTDGSSGYLEQMFFWVPKGSSICMGYSAYETTSSVYYYNLSEYARVYTNSNVGCMGSVQIMNYADWNDRFGGFTFTKTNSDSSFETDESLGINNFRFRVQPSNISRYKLVATNIPLVKCAENLSGSITDYSNCKKFLDGDTSLADNSDPDYVDKPTYPAESFYWDSMTCKVARVGSNDNKSRYAFSFQYDYSCPLMKDTSEMFSCKVIYNVDIAYRDGKGRTFTHTDSKEDTFSLNKHRGGYLNDKVYLNGDIGALTQGVSMLEALDYLTCFVPNSSGSSLDKYTEYSVTSAKLYVTVFLYHVPDPDTLFSDSDIMQSASNNMIQSTDVRYFPFDLYTLEEDKEVASEKPTVTTEDVVDGNGNVVDKKVTDVVASDDSGKTVINITIDNSNKVIDGNANINTGGGSSDDDEDKNSKSFWKYVTGIVAFFTALLNSDSGLFAVIASYFKFIPADFWSVTIGAIVVIAILSIYRLAKKGG